jgi:predicted lipid-binding transport protein (Tim44 family)
LAFHESRIHKTANKTQKRRTKMSRRLLIIAATAVVLCLGLANISGCANNAQTYGAIGGAGGAVIGGVTGGFGGAVIGGAIGGGAGYVIGNEQDK